MSTSTHRAELVTYTPPLVDEARIAVAGFLARYSGPTRISYAADLRYWFTWCDSVSLNAFEAQSYIKRKEACRQVAEAKTEDTRATRVQKVVDSL